MLNVIFVYIYIIIYLGKQSSFYGYKQFAELGSNSSPVCSHQFPFAHFREENLKNPDHQFDFSFMAQIYAVLDPVFAQLNHKLFCCWIIN